MSKAPDAFRTIGEVAELLETPAHVLRFWESRFPQIKPVKRAGGRRYYRPADLALLAGIRRLLHDEGLTIRGVQKILREQGVRFVSGLAEEDESEVAGFADEGAVDAPQPVSEPIPLFPNLPITPAPVRDFPEGVMENISAADPSDAEDESVSVAYEPDHSTDGQSAAPTKAADEPPAEASDDIWLLSPEAEPIAEYVLSEPLATEPSAEAPEFPFDGPLGETIADPDAPLPLADTAESPYKTAPPDPKTEEIAAPKRALPDPMPPVIEITAHWLPADLRALRSGALAANHDKVVAISQRLQALRNRVGDLGRVPRR